MNEEVLDELIDQLHTATFNLQTTYGYFKEIAHGDDKEEIIVVLSELKHRIDSVNILQNKCSDIIYYMYNGE